MDGATELVLLVRFGEIALKSRFVRRQLRDRLVGNIQDLFAAEAVECITDSDEARVYVYVDDLSRARSILTRVFGVVSISPAEETHADIASLRDAVLAEAKRSLPAGKTFALRTRRVGTHPFTSLDLARELGDDVRRAHPGARVNLSRPDVEIHIEVRQNRGFVFREIWPGPGGLPLGSQGRGLAVVQDRNGMVAAWMGMKRGCRIAVATAPGEPLIEPLRRWDVRLKVLELPPNGRLGDLVKITRADAVFLGTRWASFDPGGRVGLDVPLFEPVIGLSDEEVGRLASQIESA
ncbi:MAG TPA: THUMP domain-containing protein [Thermoplasmata archaeon]|nr:THUMP domain-containing protein [Thermoplasmata archaeon]